MQWLLTSPSSHPSNSPPARLTRFFTTLYAALRNPSRAIFQFYPETDDQISLITTIARKAGFGGGIVVDYPNSKKAKKVFLCLYVGNGRYSISKPVGRANEDEMVIDQEDTLPRGLDGDGGVESRKGIVFERRRQRANSKNKEKKGRRGVVDKSWILKKKEVSVAV